MRDADALADMVVLAVKAGNGPLSERVSAVEARVGQTPPQDPAIADLRDRLLAMETKTAAPQTHELAALVAAAVGPLQERLAAAEAQVKMLTAITDSVAEMRERIAVLDARAAVPGPAGRDGKDGRDGSDAVVGDVVKDVAALRERVAVAEVRQLTPGPAGKDGKDGVDGLGFDDLQAVQDGERGIVFRMTRGDRVKDCGRLTLPVTIWRDVWQESQTYSKGDVVTWAGSSWHCQDTTIDKPGEGSSHWKLMVKRGRDGKDGRDAVTVPVVQLTGGGGFRDSGGGRG